MTENQSSTGWSTAAELPPEAFDLLHSPYNENHPTSIVATLNPDGFPHTALFGSLHAVTPALIRFACDRRHTTYMNLAHNGRVAISLVAPPNIAISIRGWATVLKEHMDISPADAIIQVQIQDVKNDWLPGANIRTAITISMSHEIFEFLQKYMAEIGQV